MAIFVVDASVVIERLIRGSFTTNARAFFDQLTVNERVLIPEFCLLECTNVFWKQVRFQGMSSRHAEMLITDLRKLPLRRTPMKALLPKSLNIGVKYQLAVYDAAYVALAQNYACPLITIDEPQRRAAFAEGVNVVPLTNFAL